MMHFARIVTILRTHGRTWVDHC